ncbi:cell wall protein [Colletotrichum incanum]|uniref:Cell wall protein n=1 Tax=Colletotrichum incanum TaxID=1573173 RepID=A0A167C4G2_COLIC|nr:cell wall protein [Colletotrichum incanum]OHW96884.1 cell wall protein [Colletotrichum incanum]
MRASILLSSLILSLVHSAPSGEIGKRDLLTIQSAFVSISTAASNLDVALRALTPDPKSAEPLVPAMMDVEFALTQARTDVAPTQPISITEGLVLQNAADTLTKSVKIMVMSSMLQRQTLDQLGMTPMLLKSYMNQNMLSAALGQVVLAKLPAEGISTASLAFGGAGGAVGMGIISLSNPPLTMPPNMDAPPMTPPPTAPPPAAPPPTAPAPMAPPPAGSQPMTMGQGQGQAAPQNVPATSATTAATNVTLSQIFGGGSKSKRLL